MRLALAGLLVASAGCSAQLKYVERWPLAAPAQRAVRLEVLDSRPADQGGDNPRQVGVARGGYGNPVPFENDDPHELTRLVTQATADALHGAGLDAAAQAPLTLRAKVLRFWIDGYVGYAAHAEVQYDLLDASGAPLWTQKCEGHEAGAVFSYGAASDLLSAALAHLASDANARFKEDAFQRTFGAAAAPP